MDIQTSKICRLGIDLGGTNTVLGIVDAQGSILAKKKMPTTGHPSLESYIDKLAETYFAMLRGLPEDIKVIGAGVGAPCANQTTGCIEGATNLPWKGTIPLASLLSKATGIPVSISNDANAAAAGERMFGAARGIDNFIMLTLGTGVGGGIVCDGHLLSGSRGFAAELGHVTLGEGFDRDCPCGRKGCLQMYAQAGGVVQTALEMLDSSPDDSVLRQIKPEMLTPLEITLAARNGDKIAKETYRLTGEVLGKGVANFLAITDPDAIILFGGVSKAGDLLIGPMRESMERNALFLYKNRIRILVSQLPDADAAILGAAALVS